MNTYNVSYTLKSMVTGKYIGQLFVVGHDETFNTYDIDEAFTWYSLTAVHKIKDRLGLCVVVAFNEEN